MDARNVERVKMKYLISILFFFSCVNLNAQDTTYVTSTTPPHDTSITTTIPVKYIPRDTTIFVDDSAHNDYLISEHYITIGGPYFYDSTLYDTIPAHDTTFTQSITHDTTIMIISAHPVTIRANNQNKALGATFTFANNGTQLSITGGSLKAGDVITVDNSASTGAASGAASGTYPITLSSVTIMRGATNVTSTYAISYQSGTLTVAGAIPITITADDQSKAYGTTFTFIHNGSQVTLTSGTLDAGDVITVDNAASNGSGVGAAAGTYTIFLNSVTIMDGATNVTGNYAITYVTGTLTVAPPIPITIRADDQGKAFGATFVFTHNGTQVDLTAGTLNSGDAITIDNAASAGSGSGAAAGTYPITLSSVTIMNGATNVTNRYNITYQTGTLTVAGAPLIITVQARNQTKVYGNIFAFLNNGSQIQITSGGLQSGDVITVDNAASTGSGASANVGSYTITLSAITIMRGATNVTGSYTITYQTGTMTVTARPITVKANNQTKIRGNTFTFTNNGTQVALTSGSLVSGHTITADNAASAGSGSGAAAGNYTITLSSITVMSGATNVTSNYAITYQTGTLSVTTIAITVRANNQSKVQGTTFTFLNNGTQVSVVSGTLGVGDAITVDNAASTGAGSGAATGSYPITLSSVTIMDGATNVTINYTITYQGGTLSVSSPPNTNTTYGIFAAASDYGTALQGRMNHAHYVGVPLFRYNYDYVQQNGSAPTYRVNEITDDGLLTALTFNHNANGMQWPQGDHSFPNTTAEINFFSSKLDSLLGLPDKPEVVSINNEEGHREYWEGTVQEYLVWMEKCVQVGHAHGLPVTNGGTTIGIVYAMLRWYIDRGASQDSIDFIKDAYGITGNAGGTYATEQRIWYETLLAGFANSDMDYVNVHWYEPARDNTTDIVTSKLIPLIINYIQVVTGKYVITTEMGVKNGNYGLAYEYFDQWKASGAKYIMYYAGSSDQGAQSFDNSEAYKEWLAQ